MATEPSKHALLGPSKADQWMTCLGSTALTKDVQETPSAYAQDGTDHHEVAAVCLDDNQQLLSPLELVGHPMLSGALLEEENAQYLLDGYINPVRAYATGGSLLVEQPVPLAWYTGNHDDTGTADAVILREDHEMIVVDLKFGRGVEVYPDHNRQLMLYALGVIKSQELEEHYTSIRLVICQPRTGDGKPKEWVLSMADLLAFGNEVKRVASIITISEQSGIVLPLKPSEKACRFCKVRGTCSALANFVTEAQSEGFVNLDTTPEQERAERLGRAMDAIDLVEIWVKGVQSQVETDLLAGRPVTGQAGPYKLVQGKKGNRKWTDEAAVTKLFESMRMRREEMYKFNLISPTDTEKLFKKNPIKWGRCEELITQSEGSLHVASATDKRPAYSAEKPEDGFSAVEESFDDLR